MKPKHIMAIIAFIIGFSVLAICVTMFSNDSDNFEDVVSKFNQVTQQFQRTEVSTVIEETEREKDVYEDTGIWLDIDTSNINGWPEACALAHHVLGHATQYGVRYSTSQQAVINGVTVNTDCSGFVGLALYLYGAQDDASDATEKSLKNIAGLQSIDDLSNYTPEVGDIVLYGYNNRLSHIEVVATVNGSDITFTFNWGDMKSAESLYFNDNTAGHNPDVCPVVTNTVPSEDRGDLLYVFRFDSNTSYQPPNPPTTPPQQATNPNIPGVGGQNPSSPGTGGNTPPIQPNPTNGDWTSLVKAACQEFANNGGYSVKNSYVSNIKGNSVTIYPCCAGLANYLYSYQYGGSYTSSTAQWASMNGLQDVQFSSNDVLGILQVGDLLLYGDSSGYNHTDVVVKIDTNANEIYIANAGSNDNINLMIPQGYKYVNSLNDPISVMTSNGRHSGKTLKKIRRMQ